MAAKEKRVCTSRINQLLAETFRLLITASVFLVVGLLAPRSSQAQTEIPNQSASVVGTGDAAPNKPADTRLAQDRWPAQKNRWFLRVGVLGAIYHSSAAIATNGQITTGATAMVSNNYGVMFDVGYDIKRNFSALLMMGVPPKPVITAQGSVASLGGLGKVRYGPAIFTGVYRLPNWHGFRPYAGAGPAYAIILKDHDGAVSQLKVHNNWGFVFQVGAEYQLSKKFDFFIDFKEIWLAVNAHGFLSGDVPVRARVRLDPSIICVGIKFHFQ